MMQFNRFNQKYIRYKKFVFALVVLFSLSLPFSVVRAQTNNSLVGSALSLVSQIVRFYDSFTSYPQGICFPDGAQFDTWKTVFAGYGCVKTMKINSPNGSNGMISVLSITPRTSTAPYQTSSALVVGKNMVAPFEFSGKMTTIKQLRVGSQPNAWEVGWFVWNYIDNQHFYYFIPKPNGWELGKVDPNYPGGQRFLATGIFPTFPVGSWNGFKVIVSGDNIMNIFMNDKFVTSFKDTQNPYLSGKVGFYTEDALIYTDDVYINSL